MGKMFAVMKSHAAGHILYADETVVATKKEGIITTSLLNLAYDEEKEYRIPVCGEIVEATLYSSESILPNSTFMETTFSCPVKDDCYIVKMPPHSVVLVKQRG